VERERERETFYKGEFFLKERKREER